MSPARPGEAKPFEGDDPLALVGVRYQQAAGVDGDHELARCLVEEYALMGWTADRVRRLFATPFFAGAHALYERRGSELVEQVILEVFGPVPDGGGC